MLDLAIQEFLSKRLKNESDFSLSELEKELDHWLPNAARKAGKQFRVSHPVKFSHPDIKNTSEVRAICEYRNDGFLRTGNAETELDTIFNSAANIPIWKFLSLQLTDGVSVLEHLEQDSDFIKQQLTIPSMPFVEIRQGLLAITELSDAVKTSDKLKQVYFPVGDNYHLLSLLTPSGLLFKLKQRINDMRFSEAAKQAREARRHQQLDEQGFDDFYDLTVIGFGGAKSQNISFLNSQNGGTAYLLSSLPPTLEKYRIRRPNKSFFTDVLWIKAYRQEFWQLQKLFNSYQDNKETKTDITEIIISIFQQVVEKIWQLRQLEAGWSEKTNLPMAQKIWLDAAYSEQREAEDDWLNEVIADFARWMVFAYQKTVGKENAIPLGGANELAHIKQLIADHQEDLR